MVTLSVDPGVKGCGVAVWDSGILQHAAYVRRYGDTRCTSMSDTIAGFIPVWKLGGLIIEMPRVYQGAKQKGDPNDLIELAAVVGAICSEFTGYPTTILYPQDWKRQIPKPEKGKEYIVETRVRKRLLDEELARIKLPRAAKLKLDVWDAIGIGCHSIGKYMF